MSDRDEFEEAMYWLGREITEARKAIWDGKSGKAFASIEAAEEQFEKVEEIVEASDYDQKRDENDEGN